MLKKGHTPLSNAPAPARISVRERAGDDTGALGAGERRLFDYKVKGTPKTVVVAPDGCVVEAWTGAYTGKQKDSIEAFFLPHAHRSAGRYDGRMQPTEIDPELNRLALAEAAQQYPEFAGRAVRVVARPLSRGFAWQLEWKEAPPHGQQAWEFQNAAVRAYKKLAGITE